MKYLRMFFNLDSLMGGLLMILGFILTPFIIGIPILITGILISVYHFHKRWVEFIVPKNNREKISQEIKKSYLPYHPAVNSMKSVGKDMLKTSAVVFIVLVIIVVTFFTRYAQGGPENYWACDDNGAWIKHGNPAYPSPILPCTYKNPLGKTRDECLLQGGVWAKQGLEPFETCNRRAVDRGNLCRDNGECEGMCQTELTKEEINQGMRGQLNIKKKSGQCSAWVVELGCFGMMKQGKPQVICVD
ncbi:MAG: hypothetical protein WC686_03050 [Candidatus Shapirobacteria bacterium]|jgi:hypothetical protein